MERRRAEADEFYEARQTGIGDAEACLVQRQAFAGMRESTGLFDVHQWLRGDPHTEPAGSRLNQYGGWRHLFNSIVISLPDKN